MRVTCNISSNLIETPVSNFPINILVTSGYDKDRERILAELSEQDDFCITGIVKDEAGAVIKSEQLKPDILIMDLPPLGISGPELAAIIQRRSPSTSIILLCDKDEDNYACTALRAGITGFMLKNIDMDKLIPAVKIVSSGGYFISASVINRVFSTVWEKKYIQSQINEHIKPWINQSTKNKFFSPMERSIVTYIALGLPDEEIAGRLHLSTGTVRNYIASMRRKTKLKNRIQIVLFSLVHGLIINEHLHIFNRQIYNDLLQ